MISGRLPYFPGTLASDQVRNQLATAVLSGKHSEELHTVLRKYVEHARKVGGTALRSSARGGRRPNTVDTVAVRAWARESGYDIKDRGRVPADLVTKYQAATRS